MIGAARTVPLAHPKLLPVLLFVASAGFVLWRNTEVGVLVDIAYPLNIATRIAAGDVPYADFPLAHAPGEFLVQALLIKLLGPHFLVQIAYATILGGLATMLAYAISVRVLAHAMERPHALAAVLSLPLVPLGVYAIYPHPFYDADACIVVLLAILLILRALARPTTVLWVIAGATTAIPVFIKQNIGGAFLLAVVAALAVEAVARPTARRGVALFGAGFIGAVAVEVAILQVVVGLDHYVQWAWTFALAGRGLSFERISAFADPRVLWIGVLILAVGAAASRLPLRARGLALGAGVCVMLAAAVVVPRSLVPVPLLFPPILLAAAVVAVARAFRDGPTFETLLPVVLGLTTVGVVQSQGLGGSTFAAFPFLTLAVVSLTGECSGLIPMPSRLVPLTGALVAVVLTVAGGDYTLSNARLRFIDVNAPGPVTHSTFPSLTGLSARGPYIAELDAMLFWVRDNIPADDPITFLPGEDPSFYALSRRPRLPSVYFYDVATPYTPAEIGRFADATGLRWVIVKDRLQLNEEPPLEQAFVKALTEHATLVTSVGPYRVFHR